MAEHCARCDRLEDEITVLTEKLRSVGFSGDDYPCPWRLSRTARRILGILMRAPGPVSRKAIHTFLYADHSDGGPIDTILGVYLWKIRQALPDDIDVKTVWGFGYEILAHDKRRIEELRREGNGG